MERNAKDLLVTNNLKAKCNSKYCQFSKSSNIYYPYNVKHIFLISTN